MQLSALLARARRVRPAAVGGALLLLVTLCGCDYITSAMPPSPSPFPTLARLPTVTPVTPSPTLPPIPTRRPPPTPTSVPEEELEGLVAVGANVRAGPGIDFAIITSVIAGKSVLLQEQQAGWYKVTIADGTEGWMSSQVLDVQPDVVEAIPTATLANSGASTTE